jgi:hypothetical protein
VWWYCTYSTQLNGPIKTAVDSLDPLAGGRLYREAASETPFQLHSPLNTLSRILLNMKGGNGKEASAEISAKHYPFDLV